MNRNVLVATAFGAAIALGLVTNGCSSTSNNGGTGGSTGSGGGTGTGGKITGQGGAISGQGGNRADAGPDSGGDGPAALPMCTAATDDGTACNSNPSCSKSCGVEISSLTTDRAQKTCTCGGAGGTWSCPHANGGCMYPTTFDATCLRLPTDHAAPACPRVSPDGGTDGGTALIRSGVTNCEVPNSEVCGNLCGSATAGTFSYQDASGVATVGYCVCIVGKYQCATVVDWYYAP